MPLRKNSFGPHTNLKLIIEIDSKRLADGGRSTREEV
tara:strand:+ start:5857 stop:5967 length:111 start_codon:yes stop_codon:yes gene_type:complete